MKNATTILDACKGNLINLVITVLNLNSSKPQMTSDKFYKQWL